MVDHEANSFKLFDILKENYPEWVKEMDADDMAWADVGPEFLGFISTYKALAEIIPTSRVIYDFGCAYAPQAWYFRNHKKYIGINPGNAPVPKVANAEYHKAKAQEFLKTFEFHKDSFAIVNYVPDFEVARLVKEVFTDCFTFYVV